VHSNSVVASLVARSGIDAASIEAGLAVAGRQQ
jgi:hypothetical protein